MRFYRLNKSEAAHFMEMWIENDASPEIDDLNDNIIREQLVSKYKEVKEQYTRKYEIDLFFGMELYKYLAASGFTVRDAANEDIWRYLSIRVIPKVVADRWGKTEVKRFYKEANRIWLRSIWWYIHLSWQGNEEDTIEVLRYNSTDEIMNLVDRNSKKGYYVDFSRRLMKKYYDYKCTVEVGFETSRVFRKILIVHTAKQAVTAPELWEDGIEGYVDAIFRSAGIK